MIAIGDLSGIQDFIFSVPREGGGQARRLRARSFLVQVLAECASVAVRHELGWPEDSLIVSAAGRFVLQGPRATDSEERMARLGERLESELIRLSGGQLRLSLAWSQTGSAPEEQYQQALLRLQREKLRAFALAAQTGGRWHPRQLTLEPLGTPCELCHRRAASIELADDSGATRNACSTCRDEFELGRRLPGAEWLVLRRQPGDGDLEMLGLGVSLASGPQRDALAAFDLGGQATAPASRFRPLARYIPRDGEGKPLEFVELATRARGDALLAALKIDVDLLGQAFTRALTNGLHAVANLSRRLDEFFAITVQEELRSRDSPWRSMYTVFSGGDDLLMVGPWDVALDFAGRVQQLFREQFASQDLTLSAGLALFKPKRPVHLAAEEADALLEEAKTLCVPGADTPRNQCAALGQRWKWQHHQVVVDSGKSLARWVDQGAAQRGWLHTILSLFEARHGPTQTARPDPSATARLAYHIARNYPPPSAPDPAKADFRTWADSLLADFDAMSRPQTLYLPAALRYALAATRHPEPGGQA